MGKQGKGGKEPQRTARIREAADPRMSRSLEYGLAMLECFSVQTPALRIAELAKLLGVGRSTAHRYASTLAMLGYLEQDAKRRYRLASTAADSGAAAIRAIRSLIPARDTLEDLRDWTGHTVGMAVLDRTRALYVERLHAHGPGQWEADLALGVGSSVSLHAAAVGKALLASVPEEKLTAELEGIRQRGLAIDDEGLAPGVRSIAAPVGAVGAWIVAIDVTVPSSAYTAAQLLDTVGPMVQRAAQRISQAAAAHE